MKFLKYFKNADFIDTLKHGINYFGANLANKALALISIPVFTRLLSTEDYGIVNVFTSSLLLITTIVTLNSHLALGRYYYEQGKDKKEFFGTVLFLLLLLLIPISFLGLVYRDHVAELLGIPPKTIIIMIFMIVINVTYYLFEQIKSAEKKSREVMKFSILKNYSAFIFAVILIFLFTEKYLGRIFGEAIGGFLVILFVAVKLRKYFRYGFKKSHLIYIATYSFPLIPFTLSRDILSYFDRLMINSELGAGDAGLYSLAYNIGMLTTIVVASLFTAARPDFFRYMNEGNYKRCDIQVKKMYKIIFFVGLILALYSEDLGKLIADKKFHPSLKIIPTIVVGYLFMAVSQMYSRVIGYAKKTAYLSIITILGGVLNIILNKYYIPIYGYEAAAYTTLASFVFIAVLTWLISTTLIKEYCSSISLIIFDFFVLILLLAVFRFGIVFYLEGGILFGAKFVIILAFVFSTNYKFLIKKLRS